MDCQICCEKFNLSIHKKVICNFCEYSSCRQCFQKYISETTHDPSCMNCKRVFNRDFINTVCTNVFITTILKKHRENILLDREKALLPETQPYVIVEKERQNHLGRISKINSEIGVLEAQIKEKRSEISQIYKKINNPKIVECKKFVRKCPINECRGFLSTQWKCGSCETKICNKCNELKEDIHECLPENIESMEFINKDTKPCPSCGCMIHKISGCSQIFCVECHTAWDWNTSRIETGVIHNPHYYDFIRRQNNGIIPRNQGDVECGGLPGVYTLNVLLKNSNYRKDLLSIHRVATHIHQIELRHRPQVDAILENRQLRVNYLCNNISEQEFKKILQQKEKSQEKYKDFKNIYQMFVDVISDIFRQIDINTVEEQFKIINQLIIYVNDNLKKIGKIYKCVYPGISSGYTFEYNYENYLNKNII